MEPDPKLREFLQPLCADLDTIHQLSESFSSNFADLAAHDAQQFLPTPISQSILRPVSKEGRGRYLAIDIGGTNLRVGFIELSGQDASPPPSVSDDTRTPSTPQVIRHKERSWPIDEQLKSLPTDRLFAWIGECIAGVVAEGCSMWNLSPDDAIPLGITFSFPMVQRSLSEATLMAMGKGFVMQGQLELGPLLLDGYEHARQASSTTQPLPPIKIVAIANDTVSTLVSFIYLHGETPRQRGCMGLIVGTGCNATVPIRLGLLHESKRPPVVSLLPGESLENARIAVNTEWSINGTAPPLRKLGLISRWDSALDAAGEAPGFQPLEYMTAGRYLGELARLVLREYLESILGLQPAAFPEKLDKRFGISTTFVSHFRLETGPEALVAALETEFPISEGSSFVWTPQMALALYHIAKAIEVRAAGIVSAAIIALLKLGEDIPDSKTAASSNDGSLVKELGVGYTGGCIEHFQDYLTDTQRFLDDLLKLSFGDNPPVRAVLGPCHDGGIKGAGILAAAALSSQDRKT